MNKEGLADVIVLGLGAMGSAALYQLARRGVNAIGIDQFSSPHTLGSTHGDTRLTRQAIGEGETYTPLALRSNEIWRQIEQESGQKLLVQTGGLILSDAVRPATAHGNSDFLGNTLRSARKYAIEHEQLSARDIHSRYPQFKIGDNDISYYEAGAGFLRPEKCVRAQLELAKEYGATLRTGEKVLGFAQHKDGVTAWTDKAEYRAGKLIVSAGPWVSELMATEYKQLFKVYRQVLYWFDVADCYESFLPERFPVFIWDFGSGGGEGIYGFPALDGAQGGLKVAREEYEVTTDVNCVHRTVSSREVDEMFDRFVEPRLVGVKPECVKATVCLYTVTPDSGFILDTHPTYQDVIVASPCSGHGFKHSAAVGEVLAQMATQDRTDIDISSFSLERFFK